MSTENGETNGVMSLEERFAQLEKKFAELEVKNNELKATTDSADTKSVNSEDATDKLKTDGETAADTLKSPIIDSRVRVVISKFDRQAGERKDYPPSEAEIASVRTEKYASTLRRRLDDEEDPEGEIEVSDPDLLKFLRKEFSGYPYHYFVGQESVWSPYPAFIHNWDKLWIEAEDPGQDADDRRIRSDLKELLLAIQSGSGDIKLDAYFAGRDNIRKRESVTYETLWTIFAPGTLVYGQIFFKQPQLFIVEDFTRAWPREERSMRSGNPSSWTLKVYTYDFTGKVFERRVVTLSMERFDGIKPITSLPFHPFAACDPAVQNEVKQVLLKRGQKFRRFCTVGEDDRMYSYSGETVVEGQGFRSAQFNDRDGDSDDGGFRSGRGGDIYIPAKKTQSVMPLQNSSVMVDFESYYRYGSDVSQIGDEPVSADIDECRCSDCDKSEGLKERFKPHWDGMTGSKDEEWEPLQTMLCPPRVLGYVLKDKRWAQFNVDNLNDIPDESYESVMSRLHLVGENAGAEIKELLYGLVKHHGGGTAKRDNKSYVIDDIVAEKGKGLVFLLYGDPGVGKTSTAQMVARAAKKPLFSIGVADVGTKAKQVESNLETIFDLATKWKAILLIDEADVFLQSRNSMSLGPSAEGSALVSVFLRVLEYYQGILFLTTNQIAQFDVAVQSRVHIALKYEKLDKVQTVEIFMGFVNQYHKYRLVEGYDDFRKYADRELHKKGFDGRQIRNIVTSAMGYARGLDRERMSMEHVRHVVQFVEDFKKDLAGQMMKWHEAQKSAGL